MLLESVQKMLVDNSDFSVIFVDKDFHFHCLLLSSFVFVDGYIVAGGELQTNHQCCRKVMLIRHLRRKVLIYNI